MYVSCFGVPPVCVARCQWAGCHGIALHLSRVTINRHTEQFGVQSRKVPPRASCFRPARGRMPWDLPVSPASLGFICRDRQSYLWAGLLGGHQRSRS